MRMILILALVVFLALVIAPVLCGAEASAKAKPKLIEWCFGNGCLMQTTGWHECRPGELNVCRQRAVEKPKF